MDIILLLQTDLARSTRSVFKLVGFISDLYLAWWQSEDIKVTHAEVDLCSRESETERDDVCKEGFVSLFYCVRNLNVTTFLFFIFEVS